MATPNFSALLPEVTLRQMADLAPLFNGNKTQIVIRAIAQLHKEEIHTMTSSTYAATLWDSNNNITHQAHSTNLQTVVDDMENYCGLTPQEGKVLRMVRLLNCEMGKIVIIEQ
jgi:hypothetical protein